MLRDYQIDAVKQVEATQSDVMLQMPTGAGKTFTFCELAKRHHAEHLTRVLIVVHRQELLRQAHKALGETCFKIEKGIKTIPHNFDYYVAMIETLHRRIDKLPHFGLVIIDEAHIGNFRKLPYFNADETKVVGVTATPLAEKPLEPLFKKLIMPTSIKHLIENGFLLNCEAYGFASDLVEQENFKVKRGEFDEKQMQDFYSSEKMVLNVVNAYWAKLAGLKTIVFNVNLKHNEAVYNAFKAEGLNVYSVTGETPEKERREILTKFNEQPDAILCNVNVLTTGFDEPSVKGIVLNRATKSLPLYLQMIGRGSRLYEGKDKFIVIDLGKNTTRHGYYDQYFDWDTYFKHGSKKGDGSGVAPTKECPECGFINHARKVTCDGCGHNFEEEAERQKVEEREQKLYLLTKQNPINIPMDMLFTMAEERGWKPYAVLHRVADHIVKYQKRHIDIVTDEFCAAEGVKALVRWSEKYNIKNNKWHRDLIVQLIEDKKNA